MTRIAANLLFAISLLRGNFLDVRVYRSMTAIRNSVVIVLAGIYLLGLASSRGLYDIFRPANRCRWMGSSFS